MAKIITQLNILNIALLIFGNIKTAGKKSAYYFIGMRLNFANRSGVF